MKWLYEIEWMDGRKDNFVTYRKRHPDIHGTNLVIDLNPHGQRSHELVIPLANVRAYWIKETA